MLVAVEGTVGVRIGMMMAVDSIFGRGVPVASEIGDTTGVTVVGMGCADSTRVVGDGDSSLPLEHATITRGSTPESNAMQIRRFRLKSTQAKSVIPIDLTKLVHPGADLSRLEEVDTGVTV